ncbi:MAG: neutral/alkaline non-lysosomal ceramidase N-terminal domain-containing protein [Verrucomicrobiae bacterium]|nr:neutral/alkaline non-lysosomal ceramidase N-terminal domain-containing protein [Verrucomicrobiae bacterium]
MKRLNGALPILLLAGFVGAWLFLARAAEDTGQVIGWKAGAATTTITPTEPLWMAGYGGRKAPAEGKLTDLHAKALALEDATGNRGLIITLDLVGIDRGLAGRICQRLAESHGLKREQIAIATSHTHSGPAVGRRNLGPLHWWHLDPDQQARIDAYAETLVEKVVAVAGEAIEKLAPARVQQGSGRATFAVNRRENKPYDQVPEWRARGELKGPVDHDVPVLSVRDPESGALRAVLFGYACHATVLGGQEWCGDYPGYAQAAVEAANPGCVALFWAGCGGDQNPLPRKTVELAQSYGDRLALAVQRELESPMAMLSPQLVTRYREIEAPLAETPGVEALQKTAAEDVEGYEGARARYLLSEREKNGGADVGLDDGGYPYPVAVWTLGEEKTDGVDFVWLGGEVVVDYALRLKRERFGSRTWVAGYSNDVMAYIPSFRVLKEGGYEGGGSNVYYGLPALWDEAIEETIVGAVHQLDPLR